MSIRYELKIKVDHDKCICKKTRLCSQIWQFVFDLTMDNRKRLGLNEEYKHFYTNCGHCECTWIRENNISRVSGALMTGSFVYKLHSTPTHKALSAAYKQ